MLRLTLAQMRRSIGRLTAAGIAIMIGTAFVAATLLAGNAITRTTYDAVTTSFADADLVITDGQVDQQVLEVARAVPGVEVVDAQLESWVELVGPQGRLYSAAKSPATDPRLEAEVLVSGAMPASPDQIAVPESLADLLGVTIGDSLRAVQETWTYDENDPESSESVVREQGLTVSGLLDPGASAFAGSGGTAVVDADVLREWISFTDPEADEIAAWTALVALADGTSLTATQSALAEALDGSDVAVHTTDELAQRITGGITGETMVFTAIVLGFAAVALLVAGLVIANTFQVLVAQRTRTLALLRCVGANRAQLRRSVVIEALLLGVVASVAGVALGTAIVQLVLTILSGTTDVPVPATVTMSLAVVGVPMLVGPLVTVVAALAPARAATRVPPLAALRPAEAPSVGSRGGRLRAWLSGLLVVGGAVCLGLGTVAASELNVLAGLALGVLGGAASFIGVLVAAVFWVPRVVRSLGRLLSRSGPAARLAAANSVRNPRRTAATSAALLIGVTLVSMMSTGAASTRQALDQSLNEHYPVDVAVGTVGDGVTRPDLPASVVSEIRSVDGLQVVAELSATTVQIVASDGDAEQGTYFEASGIAPEDATAVLRNPAQVAGLNDATVIVPRGMAEWSGIEDGDGLTLAAYDPTAAEDGQATAADGDQVTVTAVVADLPHQRLLLTRTTVAQLSPEAGVSRLWLKLTDLGATSDVVAAVDLAASTSEIGLNTEGGAIDRVSYDEVITTLLAIVVGLLGVAVVIALVGVANTLSLSVIERRRESATLRAIGLSRRQLRTTLAVEGMLIALVGALVGTVLGAVYGWIGARTLLGELTVVGLAVPWRDFGLVLLVAVAAGLLASVLPGRSAARTPPVQALGVE